MNIAQTSDRVQEAQANNSKSKDHRPSVMSNENTTSFV